MLASILHPPVLGITLHTLASRAGRLGFAFRLPENILASVPAIEPPPYRSSS